MVGGVSSPPGVGMNVTWIDGKITWVVEFRHECPAFDLVDTRRMLDISTRGWHPRLRKLVMEDTIDSALYIEPLRDLGKWAGPFGRGCVTIIGDAAHPSVW